MREDSALVAVFRETGFGETARIHLLPLIPVAVGERQVEPAEHAVGAARGAVGDAGDGHADIGVVEYHPRDAEIIELDPDRDIRRGLRAQPHRIADIVVVGVEREGGAAKLDAGGLGEGWGCREPKRDRQDEQRYSGQRSVISASRTPSEKLRHKTRHDL